MATQSITVPDTGSTDAMDIIEISVAVGDRVEAEDTLIVLESDKATIEVPCPQAGSVISLQVALGDRVKTGDAIVELDVDATAATEPSESGSVKSGNPPQVTEPQRNERVTDDAALEVHHSAEPVAPLPVTDAPDSHKSATDASVYAGPAVRKLARELGVDIALVSGSGPRQRVVKDDLHAYVKQRMTQTPTAASNATGSGLPPLPEIDFSQFGPIDRQELSKINKVSAANLHRAWLHIPHVTQFDEADISELEAFRKQEGALLNEQGIRLTLLAFLVKACAQALKAFPNFNSSLSQDGTQLIRKQYYHIGIAVDTPNGLVVPVLRDVEQKTLIDIASELQDVSQKARDKKLMPKDMQGGCLSISSLGGIGGTAFTPIVNWPEVALLGVSRAQIKPVYINNEFVPRLMLPLSLSYDHRVIDGADAARFTTYLNQQLSDIRRLLL